MGMYSVSDYGHIRESSERNDSEPARLGGRKVSEGCRRINFVDFFVDSSKRRGKAVSTATCFMFFRGITRDAALIWIFVVQSTKLYAVALACHSPVLLCWTTQLPQSRYALCALRLL